MHRYSYQNVEACAMLTNTARSRGFFRYLTSLVPVPNYVSITSGRRVYRG
jgi:hypothetical protein